MTQSSLLTASLEYLTVLLEYLILFNLGLFKIIQIPFWIIEGTDKQGSDNQGFTVCVNLYVCNINQKIVIFAVSLHNIRV